MRFVFPPLAPVGLAIHGQPEDFFPVHRIYCVGRNYAEHAREMGDTGREAPFFFMKPADAVLGAAPGEALHMPYPTLTQDLHHEVELVIALGRGGRCIAPEDALEHIWGYAIGLDMTRRDLQSQAKAKGRPWCIAKGFEASAPMSALLPRAQCPDMDAANITLHVNGQLRQSGNTAQMLCKAARIVAELSQAWTLQPGDLIMTGSPSGVAAVHPGDELVARIDGLPPLTVHIR